MNWIIIVIGNIIMDVAIALFVILSAFEIRYLRTADLRDKELVLKRQGTKGPHKLTKEDFEVIEIYGKASDVSPYIKNKPYILSSLIIIGIIIQLIGLLIDSLQCPL